MILDRIIETKREELAHSKRMKPLQELKRAIADLPLPRDFHGAISNQECAIIAEVKRRSPSKGILRDDFNPVRIASIYQESGAAAVSVLTDRSFFGGDGGYLADVKQCVRLPVLRKDFIIDVYHVYETRYLQGDAILLIAGILEEEQLREYACLAASMGLSVLCEVHNRGELDKALASGAMIIGINNRDLTTFSTDLMATINLAPLIPNDRTVVSESGIRTRRDIETLMKTGIHAFLIGEILMTSPDMRSKLRQLLNRQ